MPRAPDEATGNYPQQGDVAAPSAMSPWRIFAAAVTLATALGIVGSIWWYFYAGRTGRNTTDITLG